MSGRTGLEHVQPWDVWLLWVAVGGFFRCALVYVCVGVCTNAYANQCT